MLPRRIDTPWSISVDEKEPMDGEWLFCQNETTWRHDGEKTVSSFYLEHTPVVSGTTIGTIFLSDRETYTFVIGSTNECVPQKIENDVFDQWSNPPRCKKLILNCAVGELVLTWETPPGPHHIRIDYEFIRETETQ